MMERIFRLSMKETIHLAATALVAREGLQGDFETTSMHSVNLDLEKRKADVAFVEITMTQEESSE